MDIKLDKLIYSRWDGKSLLKLYIYDKNGYHRGGIWFEPVPRHSNECISTDEAMARIAKAMVDKVEVRVCDGNDFLVFHSTNGHENYNGLTKGETNET